jgi:hypothetical protein
MVRHGDSFQSKMLKKIPGLLVQWLFRVLPLLVLLPHSGPPLPAMKSDALVAINRLSSESHATPRKIVTIYTQVPCSG